MNIILQETQEEKRVEDFRAFLKLLQDVRQDLEANRMKSMQVMGGAAYGYRCIKLRGGSPKMIAKVKDYIAKNYEKDLCYLEETASTVTFMTMFENVR